MRDRLLDVRCVRTCVCNPAAVTAAEELHARSKGYSTLVFDPLKLGPLAPLVPYPNGNKGTVTDS